MPQKSFQPVAFVGFDELLTLLYLETVRKPGESIKDAGVREFAATKGLNIESVMRRGETPSQAYDRGAVCPFCSKFERGCDKQPANAARASA